MYVLEQITSLFENFRRTKKVGRQDQEIKSNGIGVEEREGESKGWERCKNKFAVQTLQIVADVFFRNKKTVKCLGTKNLKTEIE